MALNLNFLGEPVGPAVILTFSLTRFLLFVCSDANTNVAKQVHTCIHECLGIPFIISFVLVCIRECMPVSLLCVINVRLLAFSGGAA